MLNSGFGIGTETEVVASLGEITRFSREDPGGKPRKEDGAAAGGGRREADVVEVRGFA